MNDLRVTLVQYDILANNPAQNLDNLSLLLQSIDATDVIVLPEVFTTGFCKSARDYAEAPGGRAYQWLAAEAKKHNAVVTGSLVVLENGDYYNRLIWMQPDGQYTEYNKRHLFRMAGEHLRYRDGKERVVVSWRGWRVLLQVCYDLRFPIWSRNRNDYDLAIYVANWPAARALHWKSLLPARAIENLAYVVGVNRIGTDEHLQYYSGDSVLIGPDGKVHSQPDAAAGCFTQTISLSSLQAYREAFPAWMDADGFDIRV
jgi:omega-amidase